MQNTIQEAPAQEMFHKHAMKEITPAKTPDIPRYYCPHKLQKANEQGSMIYAYATRRQRQIRDQSAISEISDPVFER